MDESTKRIICAPIAGLVEGALMHPLDTLKVRIQTKNMSGLTRNLYRGIFPYYGSMNLKLTIRWTVFEYLRGDTHVSNFLAGLGSGFIESAIVSPIELLKTQQQVTNKKNLLQNIIKTQGIQGLYRGFTPLFLRQAINQSTRFGTYMYLRDYAIEENKPPSLIKIMPIAIFSSCIGPIINNPFDVVKSRLMDPQYDTTYDSIKDAFVKMKKEEGIKSFYKGLGIRLVRVGLGSAIIFASMEKLMYFFR